MFLKRICTFKAVVWKVSFRLDYNSDVTFSFQVRDWSLFLVFECILSETFCIINPAVAAAFLWHFELVSKLLLSHFYFFVSVSNYFMIPLINTGEGAYPNTPKECFDLKLWPPGICFYNLKGPLYKIYFESSYNTDRSHYT